MISSLSRNHSNCNIIVFCFDDLTYDALNKIPNEKVKLVRLSEFEDDDLLNVKSLRSLGEYCWTSTPMTIEYCFEKFDFDHCVYVDADLYFVNDTSQELENLLLEQKHALITPHFYTAKYDQSKTSGTFCVQYMLFRNTPEGRRVLTDWKNDCLDWCYARYEDGRFGDQMYLDKWPSKYPGVIKVSEDRGLGVAPWNVQQYSLIDRTKWQLDLPSGDQFQMKFYHFHAVKHMFGDFFTNGWYPIPSWARKFLYPEYFRSLRQARLMLKSVGFNENPHSNTEIDLSHFKPLSAIKRTYLQLLLRG